MKKEILKTLSGEELFDYYTSQGGEYSQTLMLAFNEIGEKLYSMLEKAEKEGKKIYVIEEIDDALDSPLIIEIK
jgi:hypothetical protein